MADITLEQAQAALNAALKKSQDLWLAMDIAVVDAGANLKAFVRMDNAWLGSIDIAIRKAKTARFFDMNTGANWTALAAGRAALQHRALQWRPD